MATVLEMFKEHPAWKQIEQVIDRRERQVLSEMRNERDLYQVNKGLGELYAYALIKGKLPEEVANMIEEMERSK